jgi:predicted RNase H-like HicB family nuclease
MAFISMKQSGENMLGKDIEVEAFWDEEAHVWVASSNDVPGLITEADTMEHLRQKLKILIPELLQANGLLDEPGAVDIPIHLLGKWEEVIKTNTRNG